MSLRDKITDGSDDLERRTAVGEACLEAACPHGGEDDETAASDAISDILTRLFGPFGAYNSDNGDFVSGADEVAVRAFLDGCMESYMGDSEDYDIASLE